MARKLTNEERKLLAHRERLEPEADEFMFPQAGEVGWARMPRTLPILLEVLSAKELTGASVDLGRVYIDLLCRAGEVGLIELGSEKEHAFACGYRNRTRSWCERMDALVELGFVKLYATGGSKYGYALLVHPDLAMKALGRRVPKELWKAYWEAKVNSRAKEVGKPISEEEKMASGW